MLLFFGGFTRQFTGSSRLAKNTHLMWLAGEGDVAGVQRLLAAGERVDARNLIGGEALMAAALNGRAETVRFLLGKGADANAQTAGYGGSIMYTALMLAAKNGDPETVRLLIGAAVQRAASARMLLPRFEQGAGSEALEGLLQLSRAELMQKAMEGD
ncbi:MAG: ankyrin repeat domain-containing protein, partial [Ottowia sp.]|nr:ankyrin repeat domain-containing protein [Ottowia sp.]